MAISPRALPGTLLVMSLTLSPGSHSILDSIPTSRQSPTITSCLFLCCGNGCDMRCRSFRHWRHFQWSWVFIHPHYPLSADWPSTFHIPLFYCLHSLFFFTFCPTAFSLLGGMTGSPVDLLLLFPCGWFCLRELRWCSSTSEKHTSLCWRSCTNRMGILWDVPQTYLRHQCHNRVWDNWKIAIVHVLPAAAKISLLQGI